VTLLAVILALVVVMPPFIWMSIRQINQQRKDLRELEKISGQLEEMRQQLRDWKVEQ
jgi:uncharacterized membrane-anchored protein YhcB (DUF1043 family)